MRSNALPNRPKNTWSQKDAPWTDERGPTEDYHRAVRDWNQFMDLLHAGNLQKLDPKVRGLILKLQLIGRAKDIADQLPDVIVNSAEGALEISNAVHRYDPMSAILEAYSSFMSIINCVRGSTELFSNFVPRFEFKLLKQKWLLPLVRVAA